MNLTGSPHIAVLVCDTPISGIVQRFGDFGDNVIRILNQSNENGPFKLAFKKYQVAFNEEDEPSDTELELLYKKLESYIKEGLLKGVILSGSRADSFNEKLRWINALDNFVKGVLLKLDGFPILGICFGHQIIAKNLGSEVGPNRAEIGWETGTTSIELNNDIFEIERSPFHSAVLGQVDNSRSLNLVEIHRDIVYGLPPAFGETNFISIGSTSKCHIQGLISDNRSMHILTFQGHPEFSTEMCHELLKNLLNDGSIDIPHYEKSFQNTKLLKNDGIVVGDIICRFIASSKFNLA